MTISSRSSSFHDMRSLWRCIAADTAKVGRMCEARPFAVGDTEPGAVIDRQARESGRR